LMNCETETAHNITELLYYIINVAIYATLVVVIVVLIVFLNEWHHDRGCASFIRWGG